MYRNEPAAKEKRQALVFAGTTEGRILAERAQEEGWQDKVDFSVATDYGEEILETIGGIHVLEGRLTEPQMEDLMREKAYRLVVDATHPYADIVSKNIRRAADRQGIPLIRLLREESKPAHPNMVFVSSVEEAICLLDRTEEGVLLTTGSKDLAAFSRVHGFNERFCARVLPSEDSIRHCLEAGLAKKNIICMQGPFTVDMNVATLRMYGCSTLVTKSTGKAGGFDQKAAVADQGFRLVVIERPEPETGLSFDQSLQALRTLCTQGKIPEIILRRDGEEEKEGRKERGQ